MFSHYEQFHLHEYVDKKEKYYCYFNNHPSGWDLDCFFYYIKVTQEIVIEEKKYNKVQMCNHKIISHYSIKNE